MCQMQVNGKVQIRHHLVCGVRIGKRLGAVVVGCAFKAMWLKNIKQWAGRTEWVMILGTSWFTCIMILKSSF